MSTIKAPIWLNPRITDAHVYDLHESVAASKFPMAVNPDTLNSALTDTARRLATSAPGSGHDNWLQGVRVAFNLTITAKCLIELERYHFADIVSCTSTMHRIAKADPDRAYIDYVDRRIVEIMRELIADYTADPTPEKYLRILYSNPNGYMYTLRVTTNYRQLKTIYHQRRDHRLPEWRGLCEWIETLPQAALITSDALHSTDMNEG